MGTGIAGVSVSLDGLVTGPEDGPGNGLGTGGERLHYWVMGGPWTHQSEHSFDLAAPDRAYYDSLTEGVGSGIVGRSMYARRAGAARTRSRGPWWC